MNLIADIIGMLGTGLVVSAFLALQLEKLDAKGLTYNLANLIGAIMLLISLLVHFNLASFIIELFWIAASLVGLVKYIQKRRTSK